MARRGEANRERRTVNCERRTVTTTGPGDMEDGRECGPIPVRSEGATLGFDLGMTLVDTAEMYGEGKAEILVGEAVAGRREDIFLVSKVYPHRSTRNGVVSACQQSLKRLKTDYLDLYLLHWRGSIPLAETVEGLQLLKQQGLIREFGVSNFDYEDMQELIGVQVGGRPLPIRSCTILPEEASNELLPWCRKRKMPVMAYSPVEQGRLRRNLDSIARKLNVNRFQLVLAWVLHQEGVIAISKAGNEAHVVENRKALDVRIPEEILAG